jgi:ribosomal protein S18 acetylase RimI-like enzyme
VGESTIVRRRRLRPGDIASLVRLHADVYAREYRLDASFEAMVAGAIARAVERGWPERSGALWLVEDAGAVVGGVALTDEGGGVARLRWFVLDPAYRGAGLGRRLLSELAAFAERRRFERVWLETFSELQAAARLYRELGFERVHAAPGTMGGRTVLIERYELRKVNRQASPRSGRARRAPGREGVE